MLFILILLPSTFYGQFESGKHIIGPSLGLSFLGSTIQFGINHEYNINLNEIGIDEPGVLGVGGVFRYWRYSENFTHVKWSYTDVLFGVQGNYHFYMSNDKIDSWTGLVLAFDFGSSSNEIKTKNYIVQEVNHGGLWIGAQAGIKYWFEPNMAIGTRIGFGTSSYGSIDLSFDYKFK